MNYMKPEIEIVELEMIDVIRTSSETGKEEVLPGGPTQGNDETPWG